MKGVANWDDLRFLKAAASSGSFAAASSVLSVDAATVLRRINLLEERLGTRLFNRSRRGLELTDAGVRVLASAEAIQREVQDMELEILGRDIAVDGEIRFSTTDDLAAGLAEQALHEFARQYPAVVVDLRLENRPVNLNEREADVVLRCTKKPPSLLVGRKLGSLSLAVYRRDGDEVGPEAAPWVLWAGRDVPPEVNRFQEKAAHGAHTLLKANSFLALQRACAAGLGLAVLPCFLGDPDPRLVRAETDLAPEPSQLWLLTHARSRNIPRIRAFMNVVGRHIAGLDLVEATQDNLATP